MEHQEIKKLVSQMTLEEKAGMCSGADFWQLKNIERLGIPSVMVSDGPHGLRKQRDLGDHLGINESISAVCFPAGCATAASFDREVVRKLGKAIGNECQAENVSVVLGPAMNIKRSPLCGRNFEYYSEDPYVSSEMATAMVEGVQSQNVGTSPKHFLANNQEFRRMTSSSNVDERTLREIYLASFEGMVKKAKPWTVMSSYNRINGEYAEETYEYLTEILRNEWGFDGYVVSDWGAVNDRVDCLKAGMDLEMPSSNGENDAQIVKAVQEGRLDEAVVDQACERILNIVFRYVENKNENAVFDLEKDHELATTLEEECIVLLKNEENILPLSEAKKVAFVGAFAENPRFQGGGSSHINSFKIETAVEAVKEFADVTFAKGYHIDKDEVNTNLVKEAVEAAKMAEVAVVFAGLPDSFESEGYDRKHLNLPNCQNHLIEEILKVQSNVVVVLHNGSPVLMPWKNEVKGILEAYLGGQGVGKAVVRVLYGQVNPSGRLPETFPMRLEDTPCYLTYGKGQDEAWYTEGIFVGYRHYTSVDREVLFPFGYGLSYTQFEYSNLTVNKSEMTDQEEVTVTVTVKNVGECAGKEVVQLYVAAPEGNVIRPVRELRGFEKVFLQPGEETKVQFTLGMRAFACWNTEHHDWYVPNGTYQIQIAKDANTVLEETAICVTGTKVFPKVYTLNTCMGELMRDPKGQAVLGAMMGGNQQVQGGTEDYESDAISAQMMEALLESMPLRQLISFVPGITKDMLNQLLAALNQ